MSYNQGHVAKDGLTDLEESQVAAISFIKLNIRKLHE